MEPFILFYLLKRLGINALIFQFAEVSWAATTPNISDSL